MKRVILMLGTCLLLCGGCVFFQNSYVEPLDYDLTPAKKTPVEGCDLQFGVIRDFSGGDRRILVRQEDGTVRRDEYRRWTLAPELMIQRFFYESLQDGKGSGAVIRLSGSLYRFEFMRNPAGARFLAEFELNNAGVKRMIRCDDMIPINDKTTPVAAMNGCLAKAASAIRSAAEEMIKADGRK